MEIEYLEGVVERITYYSEETGYTVARLRASRAYAGKAGKDGLLTITGTLPELQPGESVQLTGNWTSHRDYGVQFRAETVKQILPATEEGVRRYLGSGLIKGIGPGIAKRIVDHFKLETLAVLDNAPERMLEVSGIGQHRVERIQEGWRLQQHIREVMLFLQSHQVSTSLAVKIYKCYGDQSIKQVQSNPYRLAHDIQGIGFKTADKIAQNMGLLPNAPERIQAGIVYALNTLSEDGHIFAPRPVLIETAVELLAVSPAECEIAVNMLQEANEIVLSQLSQDTEVIEAVYLPAFYYSEQGVARRILQLVKTVSPIQKKPIPDWTAIFDRLAHQGLRLNADQQTAVHAVLTAKLSILTGGPGTGKTTTLRAVIAVLEQLGIRFKLASPTGRAAKRLSEVTGHEASTLHRLLEFNPQGGFGRNEEQPLEAEVLVVDEASMLDLMLFYNLLKALKPTTHLLLVGDVDQLPSVGAGDVLRDLLQSGIAQVTQLKTIFRQAESSLIVTNAHRIQQGQLPDLSNKGRDFFLFAEEDPEKAVILLTDIVEKRLPDKFGLHPLDDVQVLTPMYRGAAGVQALNESLQNVLNPAGSSPERRIGGRVFRVGDKVMQTRNNYERDVYNGDIGRIHSIDTVEQQLRVKIDERLVEYDWLDADELIHAYAISVHRSQGTEYAAVVIPVVTQHYLMLQRNLLYTAVTRAKQLVVLVGTRKAVAIAVRNANISRRYSGLVSRLQLEQG